MLDILYTLIIFPIEQIIELCYVFAFRITKNHGYSIIGLSIAVSTLILPLYMMADKQQQAEREKQKLLKRMRDNINSVFKGDKRYFILSTFYRQNNYHPVYALRNSFSILIQIPFFIAAFHFLSDLDILVGKKFFILNDLGSPDRLLFGINFLPVLMTLINIVSGFIYTKGYDIKDKIQVYGIALVFLILLYNSPSALVLYWTCNNIYNLLKNVLMKIKNAGKIINMAILGIAGAFILYLLFILDGSFKKRLVVLLLLAVCVFSYFTWKSALTYLQRKIDIKNTALDFPYGTFFMSLVIFLLLTGLVIPSSLIASSAEEFSFLAPFSSPLPYLGIVLLQSTGISLFLLCVFLLFGKKVRVFMTVLLTALVSVSILNVFVFPGDYGHMLPDLSFDFFIESSNSSRAIVMFNLLAMVFLCIAVIALLLIKKRKIFFYLQSIVIIAFLSFGIINIFKINNEYKGLSKVESSLNMKKIYTFSTTGKNVLVIILDGSMSGYVPAVFEEKPELLKSFSGFTHYPNTVSLSNSTLQTMQNIFGGYYYSPLEMFNRKNVLWMKKYQEGHQVLPIILAQSGFKVSVYDQYQMDYSLYNDIENIENAKRTIGQYTDAFLEKYNDIQYIDYYKILKSRLIKFSFFKISPLVLHNIIYDEGLYLSIKKDLYKYSSGVIDSYASLYYLSDITEIKEENRNYASLFINYLTTEHGSFLKAPEYVLSENITNKGEGPLANDGFYHYNMAAYIFLSKWFDFLKENGVYNNTRIIITADHGRENTKLPYPYTINLPNGKPLSCYNITLMVKDYDDDFEFKTDNSFMTNADVPNLAAEGLIQNLINPFTGNPLLTDKENGVSIPNFISGADARRMVMDTGQVRYKTWMRVKGDIFDPANWSDGK